MVLDGKTGIDLITEYNILIIFCEIFLCTHDEIKVSVILSTFMFGIYVLLQVVVNMRLFQKSSVVRECNIIKFFASKPMTF